MPGHDGEPDSSRRAVQEPPRRLPLCLRDTILAAIGETGGDVDTDELEKLARSFASPGPGIDWAAQIVPFDEGAEGGTTSIG